jgi:hypothetical protein
MQEDAGRTVSSGTGQSWSPASLSQLRGKVGPLVRKRKTPPPPRRTLAVELFGLKTREEKVRHYEFCAEAIGFCLDRLEADYRGANDAEVEPRMKP